MGSPFEHGWLKHRGSSGVWDRRRNTTCPTGSPWTGLAQVVQRTLERKWVQKEHRVPSTTRLFDPSSAMRAGHARWRYAHRRMRTGGSTTCPRSVPHAWSARRIACALASPIHHGGTWDEVDGLTLGPPLRDVRLSHPVPAIVYEKRIRSS